MPVFPIYALLFAARGVSAGGIAGLLMLWSAASFVLEVPSAAWADTVPRRRLLTLAAGTYAAGFATWALWPTYAGFAIGFALWALSGALSSGTFSALAYDELAAIDAADAYSRVAGWGTGLALLGATVASLAAVPLVAIGGFGLAVWASVAVCGLQLVVVRALPAAPPRWVEDGATSWSGYVRAVRTGTTEAVRHAAVRTAVLASAGLMGLLALDEFFGLLLDQRGATAVTVPLWLTMVSAGQALGGALAGRAARWSPTAITMVVGAAGIALAGGAAIDHPTGIFAIAAGYGALQLAITLADIRLQERIESGARATVTSVSNVLAEMLALLVYVVVGWGAALAGYGTTLAVVSMPIVVGAIWIGRSLAPDARLTTARK
jgi:MFS family permease